LFDLANIDFRLAEVILNLDRGPQIRTVERKFRSVLQEVRNRGDLLQGSAAFGEGKQLVGEPGGVLRCLSRFGEEREQIAAMVGGRFELSEADIARNDGENVIQVVRDPAGERA
jgi:hypothetical protein